MKPVALSSRISASTIGNPVLPSHHRLNADSLLSQVRPAFADRCSRHEIGVRPVTSKSREAFVETNRRLAGGITAAEPQISGQPVSQFANFMLDRLCCLRRKSRLIACKNVYP